MSDLVARLRLTAADEGLSATATKAAQAVDQVGKSAASAKGQLDQASAGAKNADAGLRQLETGSKRAESGIRALAAALGIVELKAFEAQIRDAAFAMQGFETGLAAVTGGSANARSSIAFVREESARLGLVVRDQLGSFQSLAAATNGTALQGEQTRAIWLGMNEAGTALHLTQEKMNLAQMAVNQIASKGVVSMEELRQQLAESLPGSFQIASRAMGMSSSQFMQLVASGKLLSEDFLPKFAAELQNEFGPTVEKSLITPVGQARVALADLKNVAFDLETAAGQGFLSGIIGGISGLDSTLSSSQAADKAREIGTALGQLTGLGAQGLTAIIQNLDALEIAAGGALGVMTASKIGAIAGAWADARAATASAAAEARVLAAAHLEAAQATLAVARAQQTAMSSGLTYAERQAAVAVAVRGVAVAEAELAAATVAAGGAAVTAETALGGLLGLVGGPWGAAFLAAGAGVAYVTKALGEASVQQQEMAKRTRDATEALEGAKKILGELNLGDLGTQAQDDQKWIEALTGKVGALADELYRVASAKKTAAINDLMSADAGISQTLTDLQSRRAALTRPQTDPLTAARLGISAPDVDTTALDAEIAGQKARQSEIEGTILKLNQQPLDSFYDQPGHQALATKPNKADNRAAKSAVDLAEQIQSEKDYTAALLQGGQALDDWKVKDAGRQALEKVGLAEKPKLTAAEQALAA
ncbi:MAG TPA: tape measure protein, partial [Caulobacteraceae bacterium]|nr:tape measure protein [Caulobacteraceae bacterium]